MDSCMSVTLTMVAFKFSNSKQIDQAQILKLIVIFNDALLSCIIVIVYYY